MRYIKLTLFTIIAINAYSLFQKADTVSAFQMSVPVAEDLFVNTALISIAVFMYIILKIKVR